MIIKVFSLLILLAISSTIHASSKPVTCLAKPDLQENATGINMQGLVPYPKIDVDQIFGIFLQAVDIGQMQLFDRTLTRNMLQPVQVEYTYTQEVPYPIVKVFSILHKPIPLPTMPDVYVIGVSGVMDINGNIIESIAHCDIEN